MDKQNLSKQNKKKISSGAAGERDGTSLLRKSEFSLVLLGAGLLTLIVFFIFFSSSDDKNAGTSQMSENVHALEKRILNLEEILDDVDGNISFAVRRAGRVIECTARGQRSYSCR